MIIPYGRRNEQPRSSRYSRREADFCVKRELLRSDRTEGVGNARVFVEYIQKAEYLFRTVTLREHL